MAPLGEEIWTLTLTPGPDGKLAAATIDRRHAGLGGEAATARCSTGGWGSREELASSRPRG